MPRLNAIREMVAGSDRGATAVEYGIMVALIAAVTITVVITLGTEIRNAFQAIVDKL